MSARPLLIFDGGCGFCRGWIRRWKQITGDRVAYAPYQEVGHRFPQISTQAFTMSVHLVEPDGRPTRAAEAVARSLDHGGLPAPLWIYRHVPGARFLAERAYAFIAGHRPLAAAATRLLWGTPPLRSTYQITRSLFLRGLAIVYGLAFASLGTQVPGLIGSQGILPARALLEQAQSLGAQRFFLLPTLMWFNASDHALVGLCIVGVLLAVCTLLFSHGIFFVGLWLTYLSLVTVGGDFLSFQWDALLLETGFLAIFLSSWRWRPKEVAREPVSHLMIWLVRWLLFRLMIQSAWVKWGSGDPLWHHFTALTVHFETQPLPNTGAWFAHHLPGSVLKALCVGMFVTEGLVPFLIFTPRRSRLVAFGLLALLQIIIFLTGNYCFFNLLTLVLCLTLVDDRTWTWGRRLNENQPVASANALRTSAAVVIFSVSLLFWGLQMGIRPIKPLAALVESVYPFRSINVYGLFAVMTPLRQEIVIEGSNDGKTWISYEFPYKPQALEARPLQVAPDQPRLDWQLWFAALSDYSHNPWFLQFALRLLQGSPAVLKLLKTNPFPDHPPRYLRASLYEYHFTTSEARRLTRHWWMREYKGVYLPPITLRES